MNCEVIFTVKNTPHRVQLAVGERVLKAALTLKLDEKGFAECGGNCACATCHVRVGQGGGAFKPIGPEERDMLETLPTLHANSRLACQLVIPAGLTQLEVELP